MSSDALVKAFDAMLARRAEAPCVESPVRRVSLGDVDRLARRFQATFARHGTIPGRPAVLQAANGPGFLAGLIALRRLGVVAALVDHGTTGDEARSIANAVGAVARIGPIEGWPDTAADVPVETVRGDGDDPPEVPTETAVLKTSSGTTGAPKGVAVTAEALLADDRAIRATMGIRDDDRLLATVPFSHSYGLSSLAVPALTRALPLIVPHGGGPFAPIAAADSLHATVFPTVPAYLSGWVRLADPPPPPAGLRTILAAGAPLSPEVAERFLARFGRRVHVFYGASECGGITYDRDGEGALRGSSGTPLDGVEVTLEPVSDDEGRVVVRSPAVALGYVPHEPGGPSAGRFRSGDLGRWADGALVLSGRVDRMIHIKGHSVNPVEVERVLAAMPGIEDAHVDAIGVGDGSQPVLRAIVAGPPDGPPADAVRTWCRERLSAAKTPRTVVRVLEIPRDARGKPDVGRLATDAPPRIGR